jgi:hypothetical protein
MITNLHRFPIVLSACVVLAMASASQAAPVLWITDSSGNIGQVDIATHSVVAGSVHSTGQGLTDIAFNSAGTLFGTTFAGLFTINTSTGSATSVGSYGSVNGMNALIGNGANLFGAAFNTNTIYSISASNAAVSTFATSTAPSAGDLAFAGSSLFESAVSATGTNELVNVSTGTVIGIFHVGNAAGATLTDVFGLADDGTTLYGVSGTTVYSVDRSTAILTTLFNYSTAENGQNLGASLGAAFINEATLGSVPEPESLALVGLGLVAIAAARRKRTR